MDEWCRKEAARIIAESSERKKEMLTRPFGYETPGGAGQAGAAEPASTSASSSSGWPREFKKQKTDEMSDPVAPRSLFQDGDEDMLTEEEMKRRRDARVEAPKQQAQHKELPTATAQNDFWAQMGCMLDTRLDNMRWAASGPQRSPR